MKTPIAAAAAALAIMSASPAAADTVVINFDTLAHDYAVRRTGFDPIRAMGFRSSSLWPDGGSGVIWGKNSPSNGDPGGATFGSEGGSILVRRSDNMGTFDILSFDIGDLPNTGISGEFWVSGLQYPGNGTTVVLPKVYFTLDNLVGLQTFALSGFTQLGYVRFGGDWQGIGLQIDNLVLTNTAALTVPEPSTWAMMIIGFGAVGSMVRGNRRRSHQAL